MIKKLTLSVDSKVVDAAHKLAHRRGRSVSRMFSEFIANQPHEGASPRSSWLNELAGKFRNANLADRKSLRRAMLERND